MKRKPSIQSKWLRISDAVEYTGIGRSTLYKALHSGELKSTTVRQKGNIKGVVLIAIGDLDRYIESFSLESSL